MSFARFFTVFTKELIEHARDRRSLLSASIGVILGPLMLAFIVNEAAEDRREMEQMTIPIVGLERAPELAQWLTQQSGVEIEAYDGDPAEAVRSGELLVALEIDEEFRERFTSGKPAEVRVLFNDRKGKSRGRASRLRRLLHGYSDSLGALRLIARGLAPDVARTLRVEDVEVSADDSRGRQVLGIFPMMILLAAFAAGMPAAADSTAGERERGSLEALLGNPITAIELMTGKWVAAAALATFGLAASLAFFFVVLSQVPLYEIGVRLRLSSELAASVLLIGLPVAMFAPAFEMLIALFARSLKEAQSYLAFAIMLPMIPMMIATMSDAQGSPILELIPILGQSQTIIHIMLGQPWNLAYALGCAAITLALAGACVLGLARMLRREKIVFGR